MNRRNLLKSLCALPFVGSSVKKPANIGKLVNAVECNDVRFTAVMIKARTIVARINLPKELLDDSHFFAADHVDKMLKEELL